MVVKEKDQISRREPEFNRNANGFLIKMKELEDEILFKLANAQGDITEDVI